MWRHPGNGAGRLQPSSPGVAGLLSSLGAALGGVVALVALLVDPQEEPVLRPRFAS